MGVSFRILDDLNVVYVKYVGRPSIKEMIDCFSEYMSHPKCRPGQKQFVDLSEVIEPFFDYASMMKFMAQMTEQFRPDGPQTLLACYAPTDAARKIAFMGLRSWSGTDIVVYRIFDDLGAALEFLGIPDKSASALFGIKTDMAEKQSRVI